MINSDDEIVKDEYLIKTLGNKLDCERYFILKSDSICGTYALGYNGNNFLQPIDFRGNSTQFLGNLHENPELWKKVK